MQILGIVNLTRDSFSDGGQYLAPEVALAHARRLVAEGAAIVDVGAESTHPDSEDVPAEVEIARLTPVVTALRAEGVRVSVDTWKPDVMRAMLALGVDWINDVTGLANPAAAPILRSGNARIIVMHAIADTARAARTFTSPEHIVSRIMTFFEQRIATLTAAGIARERLVLDPGLGLFLGHNPATSMAVLRALSTLHTFGLPLCLSPTRKSFLGALLGTDETPRPIAERGAATLAAELWAAHHGVQFLRTHDVRALHDGWTLWRQLRDPPATTP
ncbi:MAG: dihydropteroate synthase [Phycisphaerales bacterium]|nr:dihydropteroate synthase [Phycisphaerales bacterium]